MNDDDMKRLLSGFHVHVEVFPFGSSESAMALAPYHGQYPILLNEKLNPPERMFALRHELAHVISGELDHLTPIDETAYTSDSERVADLFALADLIPSSDAWNAHLISDPMRELQKLIAGMLLTGTRIGSRIALTCECCSTQVAGDKSSKQGSQIPAPRGAPWFACADDPRL